MDTLARDVQRVQEGQDALRKEVRDFQKKLLTAVLELKNSIDQLAEAGTQRSSKLQRGLSSNITRGITLRTLPDMLDLVLPKGVKDAVELRDAIATAVVEPLLENVGPGWTRVGGCGHSAGGCITM